MRVCRQFGRSRRVEQDYGSAGGLGLLDKAQPMRAKTGDCDERITGPYMP